MNTTPSLAQEPDPPQLESITVKVRFSLRPPASLVDTILLGANLHSSAAMCLQLFGVTQIRNSNADCCSCGASPCE